MSNEELYTDPREIREMPRPEQIEALKNRLHIIISEDQGDEGIKRQITASIPKRSLYVIVTPQCQIFVGPESHHRLRALYGLEGTLRYEGTCVLGKEDPSIVTLYNEGFEDKLSTALGAHPTLESEIEYIIEDKMREYIRNLLS